MLHIVQILLWIYPLSNIPPGKKEQIAKLPSLQDRGQVKNTYHRVHREHRVITGKRLCVTLCPPW